MSRLFWLSFLVPVECLTLSWRTCRRFNRRLPLWPSPPLIPGGTARMMRKKRDISSLGEIWVAHDICKNMIISLDWFHFSNKTKKKLSWGLSRLPPKWQNWEFGWMSLRKAVQLCWLGFSACIWNCVIDWQSKAKFKCRLIVCLYPDWWLNQQTFICTLYSELKDQSL